MMENHKHCIFCGDVITWRTDDSAICQSPFNTSQPDTTGKRYHVTLPSVKVRAQAAAESARAMFFKRQSYEKD